MAFSIDHTVSILERTPAVLATLLSHLPEHWTMNNEGGETWSPFDVIGHLIHGEETDWIPRLELILSNGEEKTFTPFNRFAQMENSKGKTLQQLLERFSEIRAQNLLQLRLMKITENDLERTALHPALGRVNLHNLLATWAAHDLDHLAQIARVMAKQYRSDVGPWTQYLRVMNEP